MSYFLEGMSLLVFDYTVEVRRSSAVSSIDYRMKPSRHRLKPLVSSASLDEDVCLNQCFRS